MFIKRGYLAALLACLSIISFSMAFAQSDGIQASLQPLIVDIQQVIPVNAEVSIPFGEGSITATVPLTMNVNLQIDIASAQIANIVAEPAEADIAAQVPTPVPGVAEPLSVENLNVLFMDDFSNSESGWELYSPHSRNDAQYMNGELVLSDPDDHNSYESNAYANASLRFDDFVFRWDMRWSGGSVGGRSGARFRKIDRRNYYYFEIGNDGIYSFGKVSNDSATLLDEDFSDVLDRNGDTNAIQIEASGSNIRVFANGNLITEAQDVDHDFGDVEFYVAKPEGGEFFEMSFDNVVVARFPE